MKKRVSILVIALVILFFILLSLYSTDKLPKLTEKKEIKTIKIGFLGDLTHGRLGQGALLGAQIAADELNSNAETTGNKIELIAYDTKNQSDLIETYFAKLANEDKVLAIISAHPNRGPFATNNKVPAIITGIDMLKPQRRTPFYYGLRLSYIIDDAVFQAVKRLKREASIKTAIIVTDNAQLRNRYISAMKEVLPRLNTSLLGIYKLDEDIPSLISKIKESNPDMVVLSTNSDNAIKFLKEAKNKDLKPKIFLGGYRVSARDLKAQYQDLPETLYIHNYITSVDRASMPTNLNRFMSFDKKIVGRTNARTRSASLNSYDAMNILNFMLTEKAPISNTPDSLQKDREGIVKALWAARGYRTLRGSLSADGKTGFLRRNFYKIAKIENGQVSSLIGTVRGPFNA